MDRIGQSATNSKSLYTGRPPQWPAQIPCLIRGDVRVTVYGEYSVPMCQRVGFGGVIAVLVASAVQVRRGLTINNRVPTKAVTACLAAAGRTTPSWDGPTENVCLGAWRRTQRGQGEGSRKTAGCGKGRGRETQSGQGLRRQRPARREPRQKVKRPVRQCRLEHGATAPPVFNSYGAVVMRRPKLDTGSSRSVGNQRSESAVPQ